MKQGHLVILFWIVYAACFLMLSLEQKRYDNVQAEKQKIENALINAIEITGQGYEDMIYESAERKTAYFERNFFEALCIFLDAFQDEEKKELIWMHIPMLALVEEDGAFFYYTTAKQKKSSDILVRKWSEKKKFSYPDNCTEAQKKTIIADALEKAASEIITNHNYIASQYGLSYQFYVPDFLGNAEEKLEFPMLFVVFQGWPLNVSGDITYENCMDAAVFLRKVERNLPVTDGIPYTDKN